MISSRNKKAFPRVWRLIGRRFGQENGSVSHMAEPTRKKALSSIGLGYLLMIGLIAGLYIILSLTPWGRELGAKIESISPNIVMLGMLPPLFTFFAGMALTILGSADYARTKGYSRAVGIFLSFLPPAGLLLLLCLPDIRYLDEDAFIIRLTRAIRASTAARIVGRSANILGGTALAISMIAGVLLPVATLVIAGGVEFWSAFGIVVFLPIIYFLYPLLAVINGHWIPALLVYGGLIGGIALLQLSRVLSSEPTR